MGLHHPGGFGAVVGQVGNRRKTLFAVVGLRLQGDIATGQACFHFQHVFTLDVELFRHGIHFTLTQGAAVGLSFDRVLFEALFHGTQVKEQLALGFGGGHLDHAPVLQDVLVNLRFDPVHGVADQTHALVGVKPLHGFHQAHVAFLNQIAVRQAVTQVLAGDGYHQAQV